MPTRIPWVTGVDRTLLEWLEEHDVVFTPRLLYLNLERDLTDPERPSYSQVSRRLRTLRSAGLVENYIDGKYQLSDLGRRFLAEELDEEERIELATLSNEVLETQGKVG